jgi:hypothetical protein
MDSLWEAAMMAKGLESSAQVFCPCDPRQKRRSGRCVGFFARQY